jgi:TolB-like protein/DNA-binding winged helix-turn-helix (wHTH) protein
MDEIARKVFRFEEFTLDVMRRSLRQGKEDAQLRPKSFDVLCYLVENPGRPLSKDEIIAAVWPKVIVTDESLTRCVSDVRLALRDGDQRIIKTIPRHGYLFAAPVHEAAHATSEPVIVPAGLATDRPAPQLHSAAARLALRTPWRLFAAAALVLMAAIASSLWLGGQPRLSLPDRPSIAVLPFANIGGDPQQDYFGDGIAEDLTTSLSKFAHLFVIASGSALKYRARSVDAKAVGHELGVRYLLQGSVRRDPERLRITVELVDATSGQQLWAERYDRAPNAVFAVQDEVAQQIISTLVAQINKQDLERALRKPPETLAAYDYFLQGNALMRSFQGEKRGETIAAARALYKQSAAADPRYAPALQGLAQTYLAGWVDPSPGHTIGSEFQQQTVIDRALSLAQKAVELDGNLAEARATLGWILFWQHRTKDGLAEFGRAFELNPNLVDWHYSIMLTHAGRAPEALAYTKRIMRLDPFYPAVYLHCLGKAYYFLGRNEEAIEQFQAVSARIPGYRAGLVLRAAAAAEIGRSDQARTAVAELLRIQPDFRITAWLDFIRLTNREYAERLAAGLRKAGLPD